MKLVVYTCAYIGLLLASDSVMGHYEGTAAKILIWVVEVMISFIISLAAMEDLKTWLAHR